jgi:hypothetical protein
MFIRLLVRLFGERATRTKHGAFALRTARVELWVWRGRFYELPKGWNGSVAWSWNHFGRWRWGRMENGAAKGFYIGPICVWGIKREYLPPKPSGRPCTQSTCDGWDDPDSRCPRRPRDCKRFS